MAEVNPLYVKILDSCKARSPEPLYPKPFAISEALDRKALDEALDYLRLHGLIQLTEWVKDLGQGYALTPDGERILANPLLLNRPLPKVRPARAESLERTDTTWRRGEAIRDSALEPPLPRLTPLLLAANIIVFILGWLEASRQGEGRQYLLGEAAPGLGVLYLEMGSLYPPYVELGDWWRLLSYAFLHRGLLHLFLNMGFLYNLGPIIEGLWGWQRFGLLYAAGAIGGGTAVYLVSQSAVGASGALSGLLLSIAVWVYMSRGHLPEDLLRRWQSNLVVNIFLLLVISFLPGVSWAGHLGGAIGGGVMAIALHWNRFGIGFWRWLGLAGMALVPAAMFTIVYLPYSEPRELASFRPLLDRHTELDRELWAFQKTYGAKILKEGPLLGMDQSIALDRISGVVTDLQDLVDTLQARNLRSEKLQMYAPVMEELLTTQLSLAEFYQKALENPQAWNDAARNRLNQLVTAYRMERAVLGGDDR